MSIIIDGKSLCIHSLIKVARNNEKIELHTDSINRIVSCRNMVEDKISKKEIVYGINTGIGEFSETVLNDNQIEDFQKYLVY